MVTELNEDWKKVLEKERIAVVKMYADWCSPCKFYASHFQRFSDNLGVYMDTEIKYYQCNNDKLNDLKMRYEVDTLPTTLFLIHGVLIYKVIGVTRQKVIEDLLEKTLKTKYHKE